MSFFFKRFGSDAKQAATSSDTDTAKRIVLAKDKTKMRHYVSIVLGKDIQIASGDFVVIKDCVVSNDFTGVFTRGAAYVLHVKERESDEKPYPVGHTRNATLVYSNGVEICSAKWDARLLRPANDFEKTTSMRVDPLLQAFIADGVNVSNCAVESRVRPRAGIRFVCKMGSDDDFSSSISFSSSQSKVTPLLDFAAVLYKPVYNVGTSPLDKVYLVGFDENRKLIHFETEAYKLCHIEEEDASSQPPKDDGAAATVIHA